MGEADYQRLLGVTKANASDDAFYSVPWQPGIAYGLSIAMQRDLPLLILSASGNPLRRTSSFGVKARNGSWADMEVQFLLKNFVTVAESSKPSDERSGAETSWLTDAGVLGQGKEGLFAVTPSGTLLGFSSDVSDASKLVQMLKGAVTKNDHLDTQSRIGSTTPIPTGFQLPRDALALRVLGREASMPTIYQQDFLWLSKAEWSSMIPALTEPGQTTVVNKDVADKIAQYALYDQFSDKLLPFEAADVKRAELTSKIDEVKGPQTSFTLVGSTTCESTGGRSMRSSIYGHGVYNTTTKKISWLSVVASAEGSGNRKINFHITVWNTADHVAIPPQFWHQYRF